jgi:TolB-like protein/DNA-binding winged helix-turn-helix (wHTH) protein/tetratricopeptide (TPR) repeat protein
MSSSSEARIYEFSGFRLDAAKRQLLSSDGTPLHLPSRAFDVLLYLVERPGEMLEKQAIMNAVWPKSVVEEGNLTQCVFALRKVLGDNASEHRFIVTVPGRGYQFAMEVRSRSAAGPPVVPPAAATPAPTRQLPPATAGPSLKTWAWSTCAALVLAAAGGWLFWPRAGESSVAKDQAPKQTTIAVLPFADLSPDGDMEYFADGIAEEIMNSLSKVEPLQVIGRRSAFAFKGRNEDTRTIGDKLQVSNILEGSVRVAGDRVRISAQLVRTRDGFNLWSETYDRKLDDVLDIQGTIAREVATALSPVFARGPIDDAVAGVHTSNPAAYTAYLRGQHFSKQGGYESLLKARDEYQRAVQLDPHFALAHALLARSYSSIARTSLGDVAKNRALANASLDRALELDPKLADLWWIRVWTGTLESLPLVLRAREFERALAASHDDPGVMFPLAFVYLRLGRRDEALDLYTRARLADPLWPNAILADANSNFVYRGNRKLALDLIDQAAKIAPGDPRSADLKADMAASEGRALDWDHWKAKVIEAGPREVPLHGYLSLDYAHLGLLDAAMYHARLTVELGPESAAGSYNVAHVHMFSGNVEAARPVVSNAIKKFPEDFLAQLSLGELEYFSGNCARAIQFTLQARPAYAQPAGAIDLITDPDNVPIVVWCLRQEGNDARARELYQVFQLQFAPPITPGVHDGLKARMAAAAGDRQALVDNLRVLVETNSMGFAFLRQEPMIQPYLQDAQVTALLDTLEAHRAEWRRIIPKSSMRVPIPAAENPGS